MTFAEPENMIKANTAIYIYIYINVAGWAPWFKSKRNCCFDIPVADSGEGPGGRPLYFWIKMSPKGPKTYFGDRPPPPYLRIWMTAPSLSPGLDPALYPTKLFKDPYFFKIIPRARMGSESIAHEAEGRKGY